MPLYEKDRSEEPSRKVSCLVEHRSSRKVSCLVEHRSSGPLWLLEPRETEWMMADHLKVFGEDRRTEVVATGSDGVWEGLGTTFRII